MILLPALTVMVCRLCALEVEPSVVTATFVTLLLVARRSVLSACLS